MRKTNWDDIQESTGKGNRPPVGGYVLCIVDCKEQPEKEYFVLEWDYAEGQYENHNQDMYTKNNWGYPRFYRSYKESALGMLKHFLICLEKSNPGFDMKAWNNRPDKEQAPALNGLLFGAVIGEEEYRAKDGKVKVRQVITDVLPAADIRAGKFEVPPLKKLEGGNGTSAPAPTVSPAAPTAAPVEPDTNECPF